MRGGGALAITDPKEPREGDGLGLARGSGLRMERCPAGMGQIGMMLARADYDRHPTALLRFYF